MGKSNSVLVITLPSSNSGDLETAVRNLVEVDRKALKLSQKSLEVAEEILEEVKKRKHKHDDDV